MEMAPGPVGPSEDAVGPAGAELKGMVGGSLDLASDSSLQNVRWKNRNQAFPSLCTVGITTQKLILSV